MNKTISVIIPTHNRCRSLERLLNILGEQTYPLHLLQAIVVADGCSDETLQFLSNYQSFYNLQFTALPGLGAATARNIGVEKATGEILIFLDDDIEPSEGLVQAHAAAHGSDNTVVIGFLPMSLPKKATLHQINLTSWWDSKYFEMKNRYYRYNYEDLLSGNFSISARFFDEVKKFDCSFLCREDYELGARLIKAGADFTFSAEAWGFHRDEVTDFPRLLQRRRDEGRADVNFVGKHPGLLKRLRLNQYRGTLSFRKKIILYFAFDNAYLGDTICNNLLSLLNTYERLKKRQSWHGLNYKLNDYWYLRGVADELKTKEAFLSYLELTHAQMLKEYKGSLKVDLKAGIQEAEKLVDCLRPEAMQIFFGDHFIGKVKPVAGAERLRGIHLKSILATQFPDTLTHALMVEKIIKHHPNNSLDIKASKINSLTSITSIHGN
jgi:glycosyltransferase involved in cell wall biosynthesis